MKHFLTAIAVLASSAGAAAAPGASPSPAAIEIAGDAEQLVVVIPGAVRTGAIVRLYERKKGTWLLAHGDITASVGKNGFAAAGAKREGDGKTPSGAWPLTSTFGKPKTVASKMPYRQATESDFWIDDPEAAAYNTWVTSKSGPPSAKSFERLLRKDHLYDLAIVVGYNTDPIVAGAGSAIFVHVWRRPGAPTAGCVAMAKEDLAALVAWLDPARRPRIVLGKPGD